MFSFHCVTITPRSSAYVLCPFVVGVVPQRAVFSAPPYGLAAQLPSLGATGKTDDRKGLIQQAMLRSFVPIATALPQRDVPSSRSKLSVRRQLDDDMGSGPLEEEQPPLHSLPAAPGPLWDAAAWQRRALTFLGPHRVQVTSLLTACSSWLLKLAKASRIGQSHLLVALMPTVRRRGQVSRPQSCLLIHRVACVWVWVWVWVGVCVPAPGGRRGQSEDAASNPSRPRARRVCRRPGLDHFFRHCSHVSTVYANRGQGQGAAIDCQPRGRYFATPPPPAVRRDAGR